MSRPPDSQRDSLLSRRQFLGVSGLGLGAVAFATNTLPAPVVEARTKHRDIPSVPPQIEIPAAHIEAAKSHAKQLADDAKRAWSRADTSSLDESDSRILKEGPEKAQNQINEIPPEPGNPRTLEKIQYSAGVAAETLGAAQYLNDEYSEKDYETEASKLRSNVESVTNRIEIECDDPHEFLVHVGRVEYHLQQAAGFSRRVSPPEDAMEAGEMLWNLESARRDFEDGKRLYWQYRNGLENPKSFERELTRNRKWLKKAAETLRGQDDEDSGGDLPDNAYRQIRGRIYTHGWFYGRNRLNEAERCKKEGLDVLAAVATAEARQHFLAWHHAENRVEVSEDAERIDAKLVFRAKRAAVNELQNAIDGSEERLFTRKLLETAENRTDSGDSALGFSEYPRAEAYGRYLLGRAHAEHANGTATKLTRW